VTLKPLVVSAPVEVAHRLEQLGLSVDLLHESIMFGEGYRNSCTINDPPMLPGLLGWGRTMRGIRERLIPHYPDWRRSDVGNYSTVVNDAKHIAIAVATGDENTGRAGRAPKTKHPKGPATMDAVRRNVAQLELFDRPPVQPPENSQDLTWLLLIASSEEGVFGELSLPDFVGPDDRVEQWNERIILGKIHSDDGPARGTVESAPDIEVEVKRRA
jgi:hypothetical protein